MLNILRASLKSLDDSFMLSYKQVKNETEKLNLSIRRWLEFQIDSKNFIIENN